MNNIFDKLQKNNKKIVNIHAQEFYMTLSFTFLLTSVLIVVSFCYKRPDKLYLALSEINQMMVPTITSFVGVTFLANIYKIMSNKTYSFMKNILLFIFLLPYTMFYILYYGYLNKSCDCLWMEILAWVLPVYSIFLIIMSILAYKEVEMNLKRP